MSSTTVSSLPNWAAWATPPACNSWVVGVVQWMPTLHFERFQPCSIRTPSLDRGWPSRPTLLSTLLMLLASRNTGTRLGGKFIRNSIKQPTVVPEDTSSTAHRYSFPSPRELGDVSKPSRFGAAVLKSSYQYPTVESSAWMSMAALTRCVMGAQDSSAHLATAALGRGPEEGAACAHAISNELAPSWQT